MVVHPLTLTARRRWVAGQDAGGEFGDARVLEFLELSLAAYRLGLCRARSYRRLAVAGFPDVPGLTACALSGRPVVSMIYMIDSSGRRFRWAAMPSRCPPAAFWTTLEVP